MLKIQGLQAGYGDVSVLWDVDLRVEEGEVVALIGSNGAGKTTLLRAICGHARVMQGEVSFKGESLPAVPPHRRSSRGLVMVPEGRQLFAGMTVLENLKMGAFIRRDAHIQQDLEWVLEMFPELSSRTSQLAGTMSGGEQQMCAIGRGLMCRPSLLMLDELSLGLAPVVVDRLVKAVRIINQRGITVLVVEQDVLTALEMADRAYVLETGRVALAGSPQELLASDHIKEAYLGI